MKEQITIWNDKLDYQLLLSHNDMRIIHRPCSILNVILMFYQQDTQAQAHVFLTANYNIRPTNVHPVQPLPHWAKLKDRKRSGIFPSILRFLSINHRWLPR